MKKCICIMGVVFLICNGCATIYGKSKKVVLKHPETQEFVECNVSGKIKMPSEKQVEDPCIEKYKNQGFEVWGEI